MRKNIKGFKFDLFREKDFCFLCTAQDQIW